MNGGRRVFVGMMLLLAAALAVGSAQGGAVHAQAGVWSEPLHLSTTTLGSWFPDVAVDSRGDVHVVWDSTIPPQSLDDPGTGFALYAVRRNGEWSEPNDIALHLLTVAIRPAIAVDRGDRVHFLFRDGPLYYTQAPVADAWSAQAWELHKPVSGLSLTYISDLVVDDRGVIHVVWSEWVPVELTPEEIFLQERSPYLAEIFYRRSEDGGRAWSERVNLSQTPNVGSGHVQIKMDAAGGLHVAWIEGRDQHSGEGEPETVWYVNSRDGGTTWSQPTVFEAPERENAQVAIGLDGGSGVLLVWRSASSSKRREPTDPPRIPRIYSTWSTDGGETWAEPQPVPGIYPRGWTTPWDVYDMATDALGRIHLVAVGGAEEPRRDLPIDLYHLVWDGEGWSDPEMIIRYTQPEGPEYVRVAMEQGRRLHAVWFVRPEGSYSQENMQVWYSERELDVPEVTPIPTWTPTPAPLPTAPPPSPTSLAPTPALGLPSSAPPPVGDLYTEADDLARLGIALLPVGLVVVVWGLARWWRRRSGLRDRWRIA